MPHRFKVLASFREDLTIHKTETPKVIAFDCGCNRDEKV